MKKSKVEKNEMRRGQGYDAGVMEAFCAAIRGGASQEKAAKEAGGTRRTIMRWVEDRAEARAAYEAACRARDGTYVDEYVRELNFCDDVARGRVEVERVQLEASKLRMEGIKWWLSKRLPAMYGDKSQMEITGKDGAALLPQHTSAEIAEYAAVVAAARAKIESRGKGGYERI